MAGRSCAAQSQITHYSNAVSENLQAYNVHQEVIIGDVFWWADTLLVVLRSVLLWWLLLLGHGGNEWV